MADMTPEAECPQDIAEAIELTPKWEDHVNVEYNRQNLRYVLANYSRNFIYGSRLHFYLSSRNNPSYNINSTNNFK